MKLVIRKFKGIVVDKLNLFFYLFIICLIYFFIINFLYIPYSFPYSTARSTLLYNIHIVDFFIYLFSNFFLCFVVIFNIFFSKDVFLIQFKSHTLTHANLKIIISFVILCLLYEFLYLRSLLASHLFGWFRTPSTPV